MCSVLLLRVSAQKTKFSIKDFFSKCDQIFAVSCGLGTFTEEILNRKLHFSCSESFCFFLQFSVNVNFELDKQRPSVSKYGFAMAAES